MNCTSCGRDIGPLPAVCRPCGKRFVPRKKPDVHSLKTQPAPIQRSAPVDLHSMPTRPAPRVRRPAPGIHDADTRPAPVHKRPRRPSAPPPKAKEPARSRRKIILAGGVIAVFLGGGIFTWKLLNASPPDLTEEEVHLIRPSSQVNRPVERLGDFSYRLEVTSFDSPIQAVMGGVSDPNDPPDRELQALVSSGGGKESIIRKGQQRILEGVIRNAYPIWIIFNLDDRKSARVRVRLTLKER